MRKMTTEEKHRIAGENMGLVHLCANRFRGRGIEYEDLCGAGSVGLMKAVNAFDPSLGYKFSTYAVPVIMGEIKRLFRDGGTVKVSRSLKELSLKVSRTRERFAKENAREPTVSELAQLCESDEERIVEALGVSQPPLSLTSLADAASDKGEEIAIPVPAPDEKIVMSIALRQAVAQLDERDRQLLYLRYQKNKTQTQTASELSMTQVQVSRREKKILLQLRSMLV